MAKIATTLIFFVAAIVLGFFYTLPAWQRFGALGNDIAQLTATSGEFDQLIANRDNLISLINGITKDNLERLDGIFPQGAHAADFLVAVEALTTKNTMALRRIDLVNPSNEGSVADKSGAQASVPRPTGAAAIGVAKSAGTPRQEKTPGKQTYRRYVIRS